MPRIDPLKLLTCLDVLLSSTGGIQSTQEVKRLASLMTKYSKKLVSKCIYIQILKCTETELLGQFMEAGGWSLTHLWLKDAIFSLNWPLIQELLELLLLCPVDVERLKVNSAPKLVKGLSKDSADEGVRLLATKLVEQWLRIVKGETMTSTDILPTITQQTLMHSAEQEEQTIDNVSDSYGYEDVDGSANETDSGIEKIKSKDKLNNNLSDNIVETSNSRSNVTNNNSNSGTTNKLTDPLVYKITVKDGKQILAKIESLSPKKNKPVGEETNNVNNSSDIELSNKKDVNKDAEKKSISSASKDKDKSVSSDKDRDRKSSSSRSSSSSKSKSSSSSSHRSSSSSNHKTGSSSSSKSSSNRDKSKSSSKSSSSSSSSSRDKDRQKKDREREKEKEKNQAEKDKETLSKMTLPSINKLGKIPKKVTIEKDEASKAESSSNTTIIPKKTSISIEVRNSENRVKTVKTYNSQFRSHGLAEEAPPPPPRKGLKKPTTTALPSTISNSIISNILPQSLKRPSPPPSAMDNICAPPEKKLKEDLDKLEKPGSVKIIAAKPKPLLIESNLFMDEISKCLPKNTKKKKRRMSTSKESSGPDSPATPTSPSKVIAAPLKFYQDTLEDEGNKSEDEKLKKENANSDDDNEDNIKPTKKAKTEINDDDEDKNASNDDEIDINIKIEENISKEADEPIPVKRPPGPGCGPDGPPGVLTIYRRKGPKKQLKWRPQELLEEVRFFELDETERVNVTKTFNDMILMERSDERNSFLMGRKLPQEDLMKETTDWMQLHLIDNIPLHPDGNNSKEKKIQAERETTVLQALYFSKNMIPDTPADPDMEHHQLTDPQFIPLYDITGADTINSFTGMSWPEAKGSPPHSTAGYNTIFPSQYGGYNSQPNGSAGNWVNGTSPNNYNGNPEIVNSNAGNFNNSNVNMQDQLQGNIPSLVGGINSYTSAPSNNFVSNNNNNIREGRDNPNGNFGRNRGGGGNNNRGSQSNGGWYRSGGGPPNNWNNNNSNNNNRGYQGSNWVQNRGICKQFQKTRFCKNGDKCNYIH